MYEIIFLLTRSHANHIRCFHGRTPCTRHRNESRTVVQEFVEMAEELVEQEKIEEAIELYERIVKAAPDDFESYIKLATLYESRR